MEEIELTEQDKIYLSKEYKNYEIGMFVSIFVLLFLFIAFIYFNFINKALNEIDGLSVAFQSLGLGVLTYISFKGIERNRMVKAALFNQKKISGNFKIIGKEIKNNEAPDNVLEYVIKIFSEIENKNKYIFLSTVDYQKMDMDELIYIEYFKPSDLIKALHYKNEKIAYKRYQIYNSDK
ncbi:hypothetical protein ACFSX9_15455 [Flavobacterium ardleyense]|uniref:Uncharacterized protein n=1 Tax=Flavobacterium ardleyense TaxID=2038737 RepID=A0ABW5ZCR7_9FLAO